jgi:hypothetical protein
VDESVISPSKALVVQASFNALVHEKCTMASAVPALVKALIYHPKLPGTKVLSLTCVTPGSTTIAEADIWPCKEKLDPMDAIQSGLISIRLEHFVRKEARDCGQAAGEDKTGTRTNKLPGGQGPKPISTAVSLIKPVSNTMRRIRNLTAISGYLNSRPQRAYLEVQTGLSAVNCT